MEVEDGALERAPGRALAKAASIAAFGGLEVASVVEIDEARAPDAPRLEGNGKEMAIRQDWGFLRFSSSSGAGGCSGGADGQASMVAGFVSTSSRWQLLAFAALARAVSVVITRAAAAMVGRALRRRG